MKTVPINIVGPSYEDGDYSSQTCINLRPSRPIEGRSIQKLERWPGARLFSKDASSLGKNRGDLVEMGLLAYTVSGTSLVSITSGGDQAALGQILGQGYCNIDTDGTNIVISTGTRRYQYNTTAGLTEITDPDHRAGNTSQFINGRFLMDSDGGRFIAADIGDPDSINSLNFASAESSPDDTIAIKVFKERALICGTKTIEPWYNDGSADFPPYSRIEGAVHQFGLGAIHSLANDESYVYLISDRGQIYRVVDIDAQRLTPIPMASLLESNDTSDARGFCISLEGQWYYILAFPSLGQTWAIPTDDPNNAFRLSSDVSGGMHLVNSYCYCFGKHLITDKDSGDIFEWKVGELQDKGQNVLVERTIATLNAEAFQLPGDEIGINEFHLIMETGVGSQSVIDPVGIFDITVDGGNSFTNEKWVKLGRDGIKKKVVYFIKKKFKDAAIRFRVVDPIDVSLHSASARAKVTSKK